jgi:hypothetical protein
MSNYIIEPSKWFHQSAVFTIYTLNCPITNSVKYVGVTRQKLKNRLYVHLANGNGYKSKLSCWFRTLSIPPIIEPVIEFYANNHHEALLEENFWIEIFSMWGFDLLNGRHKNGKYVLHTSDTFGRTILKRIKSKKK